MSGRSHGERAGSLYEADFFSWTQEQARALAEGRWDDLDRVNLIDEVESLGRRLVGDIEDRVEILISYLLKWRHLAEYRGRAWKEVIARQRREVVDLLRDNPSLEAIRWELVALGYESGRRRLKFETYFFETDFPATCPFTVEQVFDDEYYPEELDYPAVDVFPTARKIA